MKSTDGNIVNLNGIAKHGDFAYFPGSGPRGRHCTSCERFNVSMFKNKTTVRGKCEVAAEMRHVALGALSPIYGDTQACKYFEAKSEE